MVIEDFRDLKSKENQTSPIVHKNQKHDNQR